MTHHAKHNSRNPGTVNAAGVGGATEELLSTQENPMRNGSNAQLTPEAVVAKLPEARALFREARIDITSRMRLSDACLAASVNADELLANVEDRARRAARAARRAEAERVEVASEEFMLI